MDAQPNRCPHHVLIATRATDKYEWLNIIAHSWVTWEITGGRGGSNGRAYKSVWEIFRSLHDANFYWGLYSRTRFSDLSLQISEVKTQATFFSLSTSKERINIKLGDRTLIRNPPNSDVDCRIFNVRTWSFLCVRIHTGIGHTDSESAQHVLLGKTLTNCSCVLLTGFEPRDFGSGVKLC